MIQLRVQRSPAAYNCTAALASPPGSRCRRSQAPLNQHSLTGAARPAATLHNHPSCPMPSCHAAAPHASSLSLPTYVAAPVEAIQPFLECIAELQPHHRHLPLHEEVLGELQDNLLGGRIAAAHAACSMSAIEQRRKILVLCLGSVLTWNYCLCHV